MDLVVRATELHEQAVASFKVSERFAYDFIMKVKQIRDDRLFKQLGFDTFDGYCESAWKVVRRYMDERIQIAETFGQGDFESTYSQIGHTKSLLLARMEPERREEVMTKPQQLPDGTTKTVDLMTVKEIKKLEQERDAAEQRAKQAEAARQLSINQHSEQQEKLLSQIEELKRSKTKDSPQTLAQLAELEKREKVAWEELDKLRAQQEQLKTKAGQSEELKKQLEKAQEELHNITREQLLAKDRYVVHDTLSTLVQTVGKQVKRLELEVIKHPGDAEIQRDVTATIETLRNAIAEMEQWTEAPNTKRGGIVIEGDFSVAP